MLEFDRVQTDEKASGQAPVKTAATKLEWALAALDRTRRFVSGRAAGLLSLPPYPVPRTPYAERGTGGTEDHGPRWQTPVNRTREMFAQTGQDRSLGRRQTGPLPLQCCTAAVRRTDGVIAVRPFG